MKSHKLQLIEGLAERILALDHTGPLLVGIDGVDGAGKSRFAAALAACLEGSGRAILQSSVDFFHNPRMRRHRSDKESHVSFFEDSFDYGALKDKLLDPLAFRTKPHVFLKHFDHTIDAGVSVEPTLVHGKAILVFDGIFLHRQEIASYWDYSIFLAVPFEVTFPRMARRDGCPEDCHDPRNSRYYRGQLLYLNQCRPEQLASEVIDNSDFERPMALKQ